MTEILPKTLKRDRAGRSIRRAVVGVLLASVSVWAAAQTIASKVNYLGTPWYLTVSNLTSRERNGLLSLNVEFSNEGRYDEEGFYRVSWLDADGFPAWDEEAWKPILLHGQQRQPVLIVAPTTKARDFQIQFSAQNNFVPEGSPGPRN